MRDKTFIVLSTPLEPARSCSPDIFMFGLDFPNYWERNSSKCEPWDRAILELVSPPNSPQVSCLPRNCKCLYCMPRTQHKIWAPWLTYARRNASWPDVALVSILHTKSYKTNYWNCWRGKSVTRVCHHRMDSWLLLHSYNTVLIIIIWVKARKYDDVQKLISL